MDLRVEQAFKDVSEPRQRPTAQMALEALSQKHVVELDEERKASMVSNLLVVLCSDRDAQPIVNAGTLYQ